MAKDQYANRAFAQVTESAANTLTFQEISTGVPMFAKIAWLINRIDWYYAGRSALVASADYVQAAVVSSNKMTGLALNDPSVVALNEWHAALNGTAATIAYYNAPDVIDYSTMPGGGILLPGNPVFLAIESVSLSAAQVVSARIYYTVVELKAEEYWELVEALRMVE